MDLVLVCGDRHWSDYAGIYKILQAMKESWRPFSVLHGAAPGADTLAGQAAAALGIEVIAVPADWAKYGRAAGPIRNRQMLDMLPVAVLAFHSNIEQSKGTKDCVQEARRRGIEALVVTGKIGGNQA